MDRRLDKGGAPLNTGSAKRHAALWLVAPAFALLAAFLVYPLAQVLRESFTRDGGIGELFEDPYYLERAWFTVWQAALSTLLTLVLAVPLAWVLACHTFPGKRTIESLLLVPFVLPAIVVAVAFSALIGPSGTLNSLLLHLPGIETPPIDMVGTLWAVLLAHVFYNIAVAARLIATSWRAIDARTEDAAVMLGAGPIRRFIFVTLPALRNALLAASSLVFLFCFTSFGVVLILGGPRYGTIEVEIYRESLFLFRLPIAASLALAQMAVTFVAIVLNTRLQRSIAQAGMARLRPTRWTRPSRIAAAIVLAVVALLAFAPLASLLERSLHASDGYTLRYYATLDDNLRGQALFVAPLEAVRNSILIATGTVLLAVPLGVGAAIGVVRSRATWAEALVQAPLAVSSVTLGLGLLISMDEPPLDLRKSPLLVVIAHSLVALPFVVRTVSSRLRSLDPRLRDAAAMLGASPLRAFTSVELPLITGAIGLAAVLSFATSMGEFGATLLISPPGYPTIPVAIFRYLGQPGALNFGQALAMSTILMLVTASGFIIIERLASREGDTL